MAIKDGGMIELLKSPHPDTTHGLELFMGIIHIAFSEYDKAVREMKIAALDFADPQVSPDGKVKVIYASAPDGVLLELVEPLDT